jgi:hypothetical protein
MAVKHLGHDDWLSTLTGQHFTSELAAKKYDNEERMRARTQTEGQKLLESLSAEQIKSLFLAANADIDENLSLPDTTQAGEEFFASHPEIVSEGQVGDRNGAALRTWLLSKGKHAPWSQQELEQAYEALTEVGALTLNGKAKLAFDEAEAYSLSLDELKARARAHGVEVKESD